MQTLWQDLRYGFRLLAKNPIFTLTAVLTLALGIGASTAIFTVVNAVLLRSLSFREPDRMVALWENHPQKGPGRVSMPTFLDWQENTQAFSHIALFTPASAILTGGAEPEQVTGSTVTKNFFAVLGVNPLLGRVFSAEDAAQRNSTIILSHRLWQRQFGASPDVVGKMVYMEGAPSTVIGVMPAEAEFPKGTEYWTQIDAGHIQAVRTFYELRFFDAIARLKPTATLAQAKTEIEAVYQRIRQNNPKTNSEWQAMMVPLKDYIVGNTRTNLLLLLAAVGFVLLIACSNVATLLLARAESRHKEIAIRAAIGAGRTRLIKQLLTESILLSLLGGALGLLIALWGTDWLVKLSPNDIPRIKETSLDWRVLGFAFSLSCLTGVIFGLVPALQKSRPDLTTSLKEVGTHSSGTQRSRFAFNALVVAQFALSLVLLLGAGLLINSFIRLQRVDVGFAPDRVLTMQVNLPFAKYRAEQKALDFYRDLIERLETLPHVEAASIVNRLPLLGRPPALEAWAANAPQERVKVDINFTRRNYFRAIGTPFLQGRDFTADEESSRAKVAIINEAAARRLWPGEEPLGKQLTFTHLGEDPTVTVIGVVKNIHNLGVAAPPSPAVYPLPSKIVQRMSLVVRSSAPTSQLIADVRAAVHVVDQDQPVAEIKTLAQHFAENVSRPRFYTTLLGLFAALALILAAVGIHGVVAYSTVQRTREIGIRVALGAQKGDILKLVISEGMLLALIGVGLGLVASFGLMRFLTSLLFSIKPTDGLTFTLVALVLSGVALLACYLPARRAMKVDPMVALRYE